MRFPDDEDAVLLFEDLLKGFLDLFRDGISPLILRLTNPHWYTSALCSLQPVHVLKP
jgi:hypothetical protein